MHEDVMKDMDGLDILIKKFEGDIKMVLVENQEVIVVDVLKELSLI